MRRILTGAVLLALLTLTGLALAGFKFDGRRSTIVADHPDRQAPRYDEFPVGGLFLCKRDTTTLTCIPIPVGSILLVPAPRDGTEKNPGDAGGK